MSFFGQPDEKTFVAAIKASFNDVMMPAMRDEVERKMVEDLIAKARPILERIVEERIILERQTLWKQFCARKHYVAIEKMQSALESLGVSLK